MTRGPTLRERANAAIRETAQIRRGRWPGDPRFKRFGATLLDRYEALARAVADTAQPVTPQAGVVGAEPDRDDGDAMGHEA